MRQEPNISWRETIGLIDSAIEQLDPVGVYRWTDRYGHSKSGDRYAVELPYDTNRQIAYNAIVITELEVGVQENRYDFKTNRMNPINYLPAYLYARSIGGLAISSIVISRDGDIVIPQMRTSFSFLTPREVIEDIHMIMSVDKPVCG